jgi:hypothetical protein
MKFVTFLFFLGIVAAQRCLPPSGGCVYGKWEAQKCQCDCIGLDNGPGYCIDLTTGQCSISKEFDSSTNKFNCPTQEVSTEWIVKITNGTQIQYAKKVKLQGFGIVLEAE